MLEFLRGLFARANSPDQSPTPVPPDPGVDWWEESFERVIGHEGGFQNDRNDRGNWTTGRIGEGELKGTKYGISAMAYPALDIRNLTLAQAKAIYRRDYWDQCRCSELRGPLAYQVFDAAVNHGVRAASRMLQQAVGVDSDGVIGPQTLAATQHKGLAGTLMRFNAERLTFYAGIQTFNDYGRGWARRVALNLRYAAQDVEQGL